MIIKLYTRLFAVLLLGFIVTNVSAQLKVTATGTNGTCKSDCSVQTNTTGGVAPMSFELRTNTGTVVKSAQADSLFANLAPGYYTVAVYDANHGTTPVVSSQVSVTTSYSSLALSSVSGSTSSLLPYTCTPNTNVGSVYVYWGYTGKAPYTISVISGPVTPAPVIINSGTTGTIGGLSTGNYVVSVQDACNATVASGTVAVAGTSNSMSAPFIYSVSYAKSTLVDCNKGIDVTVSLPSGYGYGSRLYGEFPAGSGNFTDTVNVAIGVTPTLKFIYGAPLIPPVTPGQLYNKQVNIWVQDLCTGVWQKSTLFVPNMGMTPSTATGVTPNNNCDSSLRAVSISFPSNAQQNTAFAYCYPLRFTVANILSPGLILKDSTINSGGFYSGYTFYQPTASGTYIVTLTDAAGNQEQGTVVVTASPPKVLYYATQLTPTDCSGTTQQVTVGGNAFMPDGPYPVTIKLLSAPGVTDLSAYPPVTISSYPNINAYIPLWTNLPVNGGTIQVVAQWACPRNDISSMAGQVRFKYQSAKFDSAFITVGSAGCSAKMANLNINLKLTDTLGNVTKLPSTNYTSYPFLMRILPNGTTNYVSNSGINQVFTNLSPGTYKIGIAPNSGIWGPTPSLCPYWDTLTYTIPNFGTPSIDVNKTYGLVCAGAGASGGILTVAAIGYGPFQYAIRPKGSSAFSTAQSSNVFTGLTAGYYDIQLTDACNSSVVQTVQVIDATGSSVISITGATSSGIVCAGNTVTLQVGPIGPVSNFVWTLPGNPNPVTTNSVTINNFGTANIGTYSLSALSAAGCTINASQVLSLGASPVLSINNPSTCAGVSVDLTATSITAGSTNIASLSYYTDAACTIVLSNPSSVLAGSTKTYYIKAVSVDGCSIIKPVTVTVNPDASIALSSGVNTDKQTPCINNAITAITYVTTNATDVTVSGLPAGVNGTYNATNGVFTISGTPTVNGVFTYLVSTTGLCKVPTATGTITVNANDTLTLTSAAGSNIQTKCINNAFANITYNVLHGTSASVTGLPTGVTGIYNAGVFTISGTPTVSGTFNYTITTSGGPCTVATATGVLTVNPNDTLTLTSAAGSNIQTKCINNAFANITYNVIHGTSASVSGLPTGVTGVYNAGVFTISGTPTVSGTFNYTVTTSGGPCTIATATGVLTVNPDATIALSSGVNTDKQALCINNIITAITYTTTNATDVTVSGLPAGVSGTYNATSGMFTISGTPTVNGIFTYMVSTAGLCKIPTITGSITVNDTALLTKINTPDAICAGNTLSLTAPSITEQGTPVTSQGWYLDGAAFTASTKMSYADNGKTLTYKTTTGCGTSTSNAVTITINDTALLTKINTPDAICAGNTLSLTAPGVTEQGSPVTAKGWYLNGVTFDPLTVLKYADNGKTLTYQITTGCGTSSSNAVTITINDTALVATIPTPDAICAGNTLSLTVPNVTVQGSPVTTQGWYLDGAAFTASTKMSYADNGKILSYKTTTSCGTSTSNAVTITINDTALLTKINTPDAICAGNTLSLTAPNVTVQGSPVTAQGWYLDGAAFTASTKMSYADNGKILTYQTTTACGTSISNAVTITVNDTALIAAIPTPDAICAGNTLSLTAPSITEQGTPVTAKGWYLNGVAFTASTKMSYADNGKILTYQTTTGCGTSTSNAVTITINDTALVATIPTPDAICAGNTLSLTAPSITERGSPVTSQGWYLDGAAFTASTKMSYADNGKTLTYQTTTGCGISTSNAVTITINDTALLTKINTPDAICAGNTLSLTAPNVTVQGSPVTAQGWYLDGAAFTASTKMSYADNGKTLTYQTTTGCGISTSNAVTITINDTALLTKINTPDAICAGNTLSLTAPSITEQGSPVTAKGWYLDGAAFTASTKMSYADNGKTLTYQTTTGCGTSTSNAVTITINDTALVATTPTPDAICAGNTLSLTAPSVTVQGSPVTSQGWYLDGAAFTVSTKMSYADNGKTLSYKTTTACGTSTSNAVTITINDTALVAAIPTPDAICAGNTLSLTAPSITEQGTPVTAQGWYLDGAAFNPATALTYADNGKTLSYKTTTGCGTSTSNAVTITINDTALLTKINTPDAICAGNTLSLTAPSITEQGSPVTSQGWYLDGAAFTASTKMSYADNGKTLTYQTATGCGTSTSNAVTITINDTALLTKINT
ncbi:beta strand repeat-containing protein, partial [Chitinophagaceae bacterium LWZ2-11]